MSKLSEHCIEYLSDLRRETEREIRNVRIFTLVPYAKVRYRHVDEIAVDLDSYGLGIGSEQYLSHRIETHSLSRCPVVSCHHH
jgi:hypothetical protein